MISIILPAYNAEKTIAACLDSVLHQTCADWELIAVNDGSTDSTGALLDRCAESDARIRCIHQSNGGVAAARNAALPLARGEFMLFLDADDALTPPMLERLLMHADAEADVVCCSCVAFSEESGFESKRHFLSGNREMRTMAEKEPLFLQLHDARIGQAPGRTYTAIGVPWGKLYRTSLVRENALTFPPLKMLEDNVFNMYAFTLARKVIYLDEPLYRYRIDHRTAEQIAPEERWLALEERDKYYAVHGAAASPSMWAELYREKMRYWGASCKYYARQLPRIEAKRAIAALCARPVYARAIRQKPPCPIGARYHLIRTLARLRLYGLLVTISAARAQ